MGKKFLKILIQKNNSEQLKRSVINLRNKHKATYEKMVVEATDEIAAAEAESQSTSAYAKGLRKRQRIMIEDDDDENDEIDGNGADEHLAAEPTDGQDEEEEGDDDLDELRIEIAKKRSER